MEISEEVRAALASLEEHKRSVLEGLSEDDREVLLANLWRVYTDGEETAQKIIESQDRESSDG